MSFWRGESRFHSTVSTPASTVPPQSRSGKLTPVSATQRGVFGASNWSSSAGTKWPMNIPLSFPEILEVLGDREGVKYRVRWEVLISRARSLTLPLEASCPPFTPGPTHRDQLYSAYAGSGGRPR